MTGNDVVGLIVLCSPAVIVIAAMLIRRRMGL